MQTLLTGILVLGGFGLAWLLVNSDVFADSDGACEYRSFRDPVTGRETRGPTIVCFTPEGVVLRRQASALRTGVP